MLITAFIFDLDGTLANTLPVCIKAYQETVMHFCDRLPEEQEIMAEFGPDDEGMLEHLIPGRVAETLPYYLSAYERLHLQLCTELFPGIPKIFAVLSSMNIRTAIVSGKGIYSAKISLEILKLDNWIDVVETGFAYGPDKPRSLRLVLNRWKIAADQVAYIGDAPYDMWAARDVGMLPLGAAWAESSVLAAVQNEHAFITFRTVDAFGDWIQNSGLIA
jgi:pyrophosphatase PpaX